MDEVIQLYQNNLAKSETCAFGLVCGKLDFCVKNLDLCVENLEKSVKNGFKILQGPFTGPYNGLAKTLELLEWLLDIHPRNHHRAGVSTWSKDPYAVCKGHP